MQILADYGHFSMDRLPCGARRAIAHMPGNLASPLNTLASISNETKVQSVTSTTGTTMKTGILMLGAVAACCAACHADVRVPAIIGEHMVLQAGDRTPIYGWADPGEAVTVGIGDAKATTTAGPDSKWQVIFTGLKPGAIPITVSIAGNNTLTYQDGDALVAIPSHVGGGPDKFLGP